MDIILVRDLIFNAAILLTSSILYGFVYEKYYKQPSIMNPMIGIISGLVGIVLMTNGVPLQSGLLFDTRAALISTTALFFGPVPSSIAVVIMAIGRLIIGGQGLLVGILIMAVSMIPGLIWYRWQQANNDSSRNLLPGYYILALVTHILMLACVFVLPLGDALEALRITGLPILLIYPLNMLLICIVMRIRIRAIRAETVLSKNELNLRTLYEQAPIGICLDADDGILYCNPMYEQIVGRSQQQIIEENWRSFSHPDDLAEDLKQLEALKAGLIHEYAMTKRFFRPNGTIVWTHMHIVLLKLDNNEKHNRLCLLEDITEKVQADESLKASKNSYRDLYHEYKNRQSFLRSLIDSIPDMLFYKDTNGVYIGCNKGFEQLVGLSEDKLIGKKNGDILGGELDQVGQLTDKLTLEGKKLIKFEHWVNSATGERLYLEVRKAPYYDSDGKLLGVIGIARDVTAQRQKEEEILYLNYHDVLTGLYNRAYFDMQQGQLDDSSHLPLSVILGDVDGLKLINDAFGHSEGDLLLKETAKIIKSCCREEDIVARISGDEFGILLPFTSSEEASSIMESIRSACQERVAHNDKTVPFTSTSLGFATKTAPDESLENVIKSAEEFMYRRKLLTHNSLHSTVMTSIEATLREKSNETEDHAQRLGSLAKELGRALNLSEGDLDALELASALHDIGKVSVDLAILIKPAMLNDEEWRIIRRHPEAGCRIAQAVPELRHIAEVILCHHEHWDGSGYPQGLSGENIPLLSRIVSLIDSYDAMTANRPYRMAITKREAAAEILRVAGTQFDPVIAEVFVKQVLKEDGNELMDEATNQ